MYDGNTWYKGMNNADIRSSKSLSFISCRFVSVFFFIIIKVKDILRLIPCNQVGGQQRGGDLKKPKI